METVLDWNLSKCLLWETEKPFQERPRRSPTFYFQNRICYLELSVFPAYYDRCYRLKFISKSGYDFFQECNVTVHVKKRTGCIVLSQTSAQRLWESTYYIWSHSESDIKKGLQDFDSVGLFRFFIFFDGCAVEHTLSLKSVKDNFVQTEEESGQRKGKSIPHKEISVQTPFYMNSHPCLESLSKDLSKLLDENPQKDVELKCGGQTVSAHKTVLCTRSPVFAKMLHSNMAEGRTGVVEIQDIEYELFLDFLRYLYTGTLPELTVNTAIRLYDVGDKYAVEPLTKLCSDFLKENLTLDNACDLLCLADAHGDRDFKENVTIYILERKIPLKGDKWQDFCSSHPAIANEVLNRFCKMYVSLAT